MLVLTNLFPPHHLGGYELICVRVVAALRARGHDISVLTSDHVIEGANESEQQNFVERSLKIHGFYGHPWRGLWQLKEIERHNNEILRAAIRRHRPDLVYVWNMGGLSKSMLFTLQALGLPTVFYLSDHWIARGLTSDVWLQWWNRPDSSALPRIARGIATAAGVRRRWQTIAPTNPVRHLQFQRIYFCSRALRGAAVAAGFDVGHAAVIYCPVNTETFSAAPRPPYQPIRRLLWVGRLTQDKGVMTALEALDRVKEKHEVTLNIVGRGAPDYVWRLKQFVRTRNLPVAFARAKPDEMPGIYRAHDALLFTSEWDEPFALTPLEAMASGLPVIGTTTGGSAELFRAGVNALTFSVGDAGALADRICQLASDTTLRVRCATTGYCEVRQRYTEPIIVDQIEDYLRESRRMWKPARLPTYHDSGTFENWSADALVRRGSVERDTRNADQNVRAPIDRPQAPL